MNTHSKFFSWTRNTLIAFAFLFISLTHAEENAIDVEAKSSDAMPTQEGTISPNNLAAAEEFSEDLGMASTALKDARKALNQCTIEFETGKKDSQAHIERQDCVVIGLDKMKEAYKSLLDSFRTYHEALKALRKELGTELQELQDQHEGVQQKLRAYNSRINANKTQIRTLHKNIPPGTTELNPEVRQQIDRLYIDARSLENEEQHIKGLRKTIVTNLGVLEEEDQKMLAWQNEIGLIDYRINRKGEEIDVILEVEKGKGMANASGQKWSSTTTNISKTGSVIEMLMPLINIDFSALNELPVFEERAMAAPPPASMPQGWNDEERMRWLDGHREERGE